ncbi:MAG: restriction endonuclease subunit S [Methanocorpusculum sp.]|nr:restriction endonuclease subunit S [Methanocorpusculum sp.]MDE2525421.1 restriction endonuclease subunit S [Methanocorpusculum sp.]
MKAEELRRSVLQLAVSGRLVEQRAEEGTAAELLAEIAAERKQLVREGKMKKGKPLPPVAEDEVPFEIPESWEWVRLGEICKYIQRGKSPKYSDIKQIPVIAQKCIQWSGLEMGKCLYIDPNTIDTYSPERILQQHDLLWNSTGLGTLGRIQIFTPSLPDYPIVVADSHVTVIRAFNEYVLPNYLRLWFSSPMVQDVINDKATGSTKQTELGLQIVIEYEVPLPPLAEQRRIVARLEELMPLIDAYDAEERRLSALETEFPEQLRWSLLQYAVEGKLVEQRPEEGTAAELLAEIAAERGRLIREGRMKRSKPLAPVLPDEVPFEIPESWEWVRLGEIVFVSTGKTPSTNETSYYTNGDIPWITSSYTDKDPISTVTSFITKKAVADVGLKIYSKGTLVYALYGQGKTRGQISELAIDATINQALAALEILHFSDSLKHYIKYFCKYNYNNIRTQSSGTSQPNLNLSKISNMLVPLPPLAEQRRIVARLEELMPLITTLTSIKKPLL